MGFSTSKVKKPQKKEQKKKSLTSDFGKFYELDKQNNIIKSMH